MPRKATPKAFDPALFPEKATMLTLSSEHLSPTTKGWLNVVRGGLPYIRGKLALNGAIFGTDPDPGLMVPGDLRTCILYGRIHGFRWIRFEDNAEHRVASLDLLDRSDPPVYRE